MGPCTCTGTIACQPQSPTLSVYLRFCSYNGICKAGQEVAQAPTGPVVTRVHLQNAKELAHAVLSPTGLLNTSAILIPQDDMHLSQFRKTIQ